MPSFYPPLPCVRNLLDHILKLATEQIEEQPSETTSIVDEETTITTEPTTQTRIETRIEETHLQQSDTALPNDEEAKSTATANHLSTAVSADDHESSVPSDDVPISFQFTPSQRWVNEVESSIDLNTIQALQAVLAPQVTCVCRRGRYVAVLSFILFIPAVFRKNLLLVFPLPIIVPTQIHAPCPKCRAPYIVLWYKVFQGFISPHPL